MYSRTPLVATTAFSLQLTFVEHIKLQVKIYKGIIEKKNIQELIANKSCEATVDCSHIRFISIFLLYLTYYHIPKLCLKFQFQCI